jgi:hypothetical protein
MSIACIVKISQFSACEFKKDIKLLDLIDQDFAIHPTQFHSTWKKYALLANQK